MAKRHENSVTWSIDMKNSVRWSIDITIVLDGQKT